MENKPKISTEYFANICLVLEYRYFNCLSPFEEPYIQFQMDATFSDGTDQARSFFFTVISLLLRHENVSFLDRNIRGVRNRSCKITFEKNKAGNRLVNIQNSRLKMKMSVWGITK